MEQKISDYLINQLAYAGWAIADVEIAQELRPDLLTSPYAAAGLRSLPALDEFARKRHVSRFWLTFANGSGAAVPVLARSDSQLHRRVGELLGRPVLRVQHAASFADRSARVEQRTPAESADQPPAWQCTERDRWFEEHGLEDPQRPTPVRR